MGVIGILTNSCKKDDNIPMAQIPELTTSAVVNISQTTADCGGNITSDGGAKVIYHGVCWSINQMPTTTDSNRIAWTSVEIFTNNIAGLKANTTYYVRAFAINSAGTGYGNEVSFTTLEEETLTDIEGNVYQTITLGTQVWMAENLKTTKYRDGTSIPNVTDKFAWRDLSTDAYCDYDNTPSNSDTYGRLYNWYAVTNSHNICPTGWHVPSLDEWETLDIYAGRTTDGERHKAGGRLKETDTTHWEFPNTEASNESGFTGLPGGLRGWINGTFFNIGSNAYWWLASEVDSYWLPESERTYTDAWIRYLSFDSGSIGSNSANKKNGYSVRCVRD